MARVQRHDFTGASDLRAMQAMCSRLWTPTSRFHPGQLAWSRHFREVPVSSPAEGEAIALWRDASGVRGFGWAEAPDWLELQVDPTHPDARDVAEEVVDWFEEWSDAPTQSAMVMAGDEVVESALRAAGFEARPDEPFFTHHLLELTQVPDGPPVAGYRFRPVEPHEAGPRSACHRAAWSEFQPSQVSEGAYTALMAAWPYRADLDWVAVDGTGAMVASCLVWLDPDTGVGLVEPVGCLPEHRGRGLAGAVTLTALHRLRDLGAVAAQVTPRGDDAYPGPRRLYQSLGFRPRARTVTWARSLR